MVVADAPLVEKLTPGQELQLECYFADWYSLPKARSSDKEAVRTAVGRLYGALKLAHPTVVFCESPWQLIAVRAMLRLLATSEGATLHAALVESLKKPLWFQAAQSIQEQWETLAPFLRAMSTNTNGSVSSFLTKELFNDLDSPLQSVLKQSISQADTALDSQLGVKAKLQLRSFVQNRGQAERQEMLRGNLFGGHGHLPPRMEQLMGGDHLANQGLDQLLVQDLAAEFLDQYGEETRKQIESAANTATAGKGLLPNRRQDAALKKISPAVDTLFLVSLEYMALLGNLSDLPTYGYISECLPITLNSSIKQDIEDWLAIKKNLFHICCYDELCLACEYPIAAQFTAHGRLHCTTGPALEFRDAYKVYAINGVMLPANVIENPRSITVKRIDTENNVEIRRILINLYGLKKYLDDSCAVQIDADDAGVLYKKEMKNDEPIVVVKVTNTTPDADGSLKEYFLRVPPSITNVRAAVAWTFNMNSEEYRPTAES